MPSLTALTSLLALVPSALAAWNVNSKQNIVVYWGKYSLAVSCSSFLLLGKICRLTYMCIGQNSAKQQGTQQRLSFYCDGMFTLRRPGL